MNLKLQLNFKIIRIQSDLLKKKCLKIKIVHFTCFLLCLAMKKASALYNSTCIYSMYPVCYSSAVHL